MDPSLKPDPKLKGSYYRRIKDIDFAFKKMEADRLPTAARLLVLYFGCEKLAQGIVGIANSWPPDDVFGRGKSPDPRKIETAVMALKLTFLTSDIDHLFAKWNDTNKKPLREPISARDLRDAVVHNFGPTNVGFVLSKAALLLPKMEGFLSCRPQVLAHLKATWPH